MTGDADDRQPREHPLSGLESFSQWVEVCVDLSSADGAAVVASTERHDDRHRILYATDPTAERVADLLFVLGYGPHTTATPAHPVQTVTTTDPDDRLTWPLLIDELVAVGVHWLQVHAIGAPGSALGTLQLYRRRRPPARSLDADTTVSALARALGSEPVADRVLGASSEPVAGSDVVSVAIGVLAARHGLSVPAASALLRAGAYAREHSSLDEAQRVVESLGDHES
ncbi:hypothetical protein [Rhodococcoides corynebacterioides]|uniref:hypothetical protein n=1 Tax=Rhodococcoides corynebacterioides TaxID=53972 RepID=UPI001C9BB846|nr:hypothetical protein [Rhodococcus corynebacterioides]MBY6349017.1 hypothetical protein [Rhodococcus corynebacterioides]